MIKIEQYKKYVARIRYHRTDDLQPDALPDGTELLVRALWVAEPEEKFAGEWIFEPADRGLWLPERDLEIIQEVQAGGISTGWAPNDISPTAMVISREENEKLCTIRAPKKAAPPARGTPHKNPA